MSLKGAAKRSIAWALAALLALAGPGLGIPAWAKGTNKQIQLGIMGGLAVPTTASTVFTVGGESYFRFPKNYAVGAFYRRYGSGVEATTSDAGSSDVSMKAQYFGLQGAYFFGGPTSGVHVGAQTGLVAYSVVSTSVSADGATTLSIDDSAVRWFIGPKIGYDHQVGPILVGSEFLWDLCAGTGCPNAVSIVLAVRYWL